jgi:hypothetical protein
VRKKKEINTTNSPQLNEKWEKYIFLKKIEILNFKKHFILWRQYKINYTYLAPGFLVK